MLILLDAGHGGKDPGAVNEWENVSEKDINLAIVVQLAHLLKEDGYDVKLIRDNDVYINPGVRLKIIREIQPDLFISVHCNSADSEGANGIEVIYASSISAKFAQSMQKTLVTELGLRNRGAKVDVRNLAVLKAYEIVSVLIEVGFISNPTDLEIIMDTTNVAQAIYEGIRNEM